MLKIKLDLSQDKTVTKHIKAAISRVKKEEVSPAPPLFLCRRGLDGRLPMC